MKTRTKCTIFCHLFYSKYICIYVVVFVFTTTNVMQLVRCFGFNTGQAYDFEGLPAFCLKFFKRICIFNLSPTPLRLLPAAFQEIFMSELYRIIYTGSNNIVEIETYCMQY